MFTNRVAATVILAAGLTSGALAQTLYWNFNTATPSSDTAANVTAGEVSQGNNNGTTVLLNSSSASSGYTGASGGNNAGAAARIGALNTGTSGSAYFEFTLTPATGYKLNVTNISLGARSTSTGPQAFCVRSSLDSYAADLATDTIPNTAAWALKTVSFNVTSEVVSATVTFRIYGYAGTGNPASGTANWRIDDLTVAANGILAAETTPPSIEPVAAQTVRVGETLSFGLTITPTDGDPVTATNVTASAGVTGIYALQNALFTYTPSAEDVGNRSFTFTATDKDGTSSPMTVNVNVRRVILPAIPIATATGSYTQDFNAMGTSGTANEWDPAAWPLPAWYAYTNANEIATYRTGTGSDTAGGVYSWGTDANRSLGSIASSGNTYRYGVAFTNETSLAVTNLAVAFTAKQWRVAQNPSTNTLTFEYCVTNRVIPLNEGVWRQVASLCFDSPLVTNANQSAGAFYASAARAAAVTRYPVLPGQVVLLRWADPDDPGNDHGFGIDDLSVTWAAGDLPDAIPVNAAGASENFNEMGAAAAETLPHLWRVESRDDAPRVTGSYDTAAPRTLNANAVINFTYAGSYNFAASATGDQSVGGLSSASAAKTVTLFGKFRNATAESFRRWTVTYNVEKYRNGTVSTAVRLLASTDGANWFPVSTPTAFPADADTNGYAADARPGATRAVERQAVFPAPLAPGTVFYLAWQIAAAEGTDTDGTQALGIDDILVTPAYPQGTIMRVN